MTGLDVVEAVLVISGAALVALAGVGLLRLPDALTRASAVSKAAALGVVLVLIAAMLDNRSARSMVVLGLILIAHLVTVPLSGMALGRAAYRSGTARPPLTTIDEPARLRPGDGTSDPRTQA